MTKTVEQLIEQETTTLEEIVEVVKDACSVELIDLLKETKKGDLISLHMSTGRQLRNSLKLWDDNSVCAKVMDKHADEASMKIITKVWEKVNDGQA